MLSTESISPEYAASKRNVPADRGRPPPRWSSSNGGLRTGGPEKEQSKIQTPTDAAAQEADASKARHRPRGTSTLGDL